MLLVVSTMTRRSEIAIVVDILKAAGGCDTNKTGIVYAANLNFNRAGRYLDMLQENHLIEKSSDVFQVTVRALYPLISCKHVRSPLRCLVTPDAKACRLSHPYDSDFLIF